MRRASWAAVTVLALGLGVVGSAGVGTPASAAGGGVPAAAPPAAQGSAPSLPEPATWPFGAGFPRTFGVPRYADGALTWSDFVHDDRGGFAGQTFQGESAGAPPYGGYAYPSGDQFSGNAADLFRIGVGLDDTHTWWRIDWNTLVEAGVPIAAIGIDLDASGGGAAAVAGGTGLTLSGLDATLVVSGTGAWLHDADGVTSVAELSGRHHVDLAARSFVVSVPRTALRPDGSSVVAVASGLADASGEGFVAVGPGNRALPGQPSVWDLGFNAAEDEPVANNFWRERTQAQTLAQPQADVGTLSVTVDWERLAARDTEPEPLVTGPSNRWYVSSTDLGRQGRKTSPEATSDGEPDYFGRVQPYAVYVPTDLEPGSPTPLTWMLHSFSINHNQYLATLPRLVQQACEQRVSICATTLQRGPDGGYVGPGELDFWEVWRELGSVYALDHERTIIGGYSMGGFGTFRFATNHPDLFAGMYVLASAANEPLPLLENLREIPYYHAHGTQDQLVPYLTEALPTVDALEALGYRLRFDTYPTKDHVAWSLQDDFDLAGQWLQEADRTRTVLPGRVTYRFFPTDVDAEGRFGPTGAYWVQEVEARDPATGQARADVTNHAIPAPPVEPTTSTTQLVDPSGNPVQRREQTWTLGAPPATEPRLTLDLANIGSLTVAAGGTGFDAGPDALIEVTSDGPVTLEVTGLRDGWEAVVNGEPSSTTSDGRLVAPLAAGEHVIGFIPTGAATPGGDPAAPSTPSTGGGHAAMGALVVLAALVPTRPRRSRAPGGRHLVRAAHMDR